MTARIITLDSDDHRTVQTLLPWFANQTLSADEAEHVRQHVAQCPRCQADAFVQEAMRTAAASVDTPVLDVDRGWAAMRARLAPARRAVHAQAQSSWWPRFGWPVLAGAQAIALAVLAIVVVVRSAPQDAEYRALGSAPPSATANALIVFRGDATEAQVRDALRQSHARIVDGPTVTDAYLITLAAPMSDGIASLRADAAVKRVESLQGGSP